MDGPPVFIVGCPRSGTTVLYHMLVSSGHFVNYRAETHLYDTIVPAYGALHSEGSRRRLAGEWLESPAFEAFGLDRSVVVSQVLDEVDSAGELLSLLFDAAGERQGRERWAECTPAHLLYMHRIKSDLPEARFVHIVRDGRDVALSLRRVGWVDPLPWDRGRDLLVAAWKWEWVVRRGMKAGRELGQDYLEVHFENLLASPREVLGRLAGFIDCELDYDAIMTDPVGSLDRPNTAFGADAGSEEFDPVGRWERQCTPGDIADLEATIGSTLQGLGYSLSAGRSPRGHAGLRARKAAFQLYREVRQRLKDHTPLSRLFTEPHVQEI